MLGNDSRGGVNYRLRKVKTRLVSSASSVWGWNGSLGVIFLKKVLWALANCLVAMTICSTRSLSEGEVWER